jgi:hypothetical protein
MLLLKTVLPLFIDIALKISVWKYCITTINLTEPIETTSATAGQEILRGLSVK